MGDHEGASLDQILNSHVGGAGTYQFLNTFAMAWVYYSGRDIKNKFSNPKVITRIIAKIHSF